jgi:hypothetical protein
MLTDIRRTALFLVVPNDDDLPPEACGVVLGVGADGLGIKLTCWPSRLRARLETTETLPLESCDPWAKDAPSDPAARLPAKDLSL